MANDAEGLSSSRPDDSGGSDAALSLPAEPWRPRSVQPGQNVSPGQQLMTIVPLDSEDIWVTADFNQTQLNYMRPG